MNRMVLHRRGMEAKMNNSFLTSYHRPFNRNSGLVAVIVRLVHILLWAGQGRDKPFLPPKSEVKS